MEPDAQAWPGLWFEKAADLIRFDLQATGRPLRKPGTNGTTLPVTYNSPRRSAG